MADVDDLTPQRVIDACDVLLPLAKGWCECEVEWGFEVPLWLALMRQQAQEDLQ